MYRILVWKVLLGMNYNICDPLWKRVCGKVYFFGVFFFFFREIMTWIIEYCFAY